MKSFMLIIIGVCMTIFAQSHPEQNMYLCGIVVICTGIIVGHLQDKK